MSWGKVVTEQEMEAGGRGVLSGRLHGEDDLEVEIFRDNLKQCTCEEQASSVLSICLKGACDNRQGQDSSQNNVKTVLCTQERCSQRYG